MTHDFNNGMYKPCTIIKIVLALQCDCIRTNQIPEFPDGTSGKEPTCQCRRHKRHSSIPGSDSPLEGDRATQSSILAWKILQTEEPGGLPSIGLQKVWHDWSGLVHTYKDTQGLLTQLLTCLSLHFKAVKTKKKLLILVGDYILIRS